MSLDGQYKPRRGLDGDTVASTTPSRAWFGVVHGNKKESDGRPQDRVPPAPSGQHGTTAIRCLPAPVAGAPPTLAPRDNSPVSLGVNKRTSPDDIEAFCGEIVLLSP